MTAELRLGTYLPGGWQVDGEPAVLVFDGVTKEALKHEGGTVPFTVPVQEFRGHAVLVGQSGAGKSQTILRLVSEVASSSNWQVVLVDAKADRHLADDIRAIGKTLGKSVGVFPDDPYLILDGEPVDVATRILELISLAPSDRPLAHVILTKAVIGGGGKSETTSLLLHNLEGLAVPPGRHEQLRVRLWEELKGFFDGDIGKLLDGQRNVDSYDLFYFGVDALRFPYTSSGLAAAILRDVSDYVVRRKSRDPERTLLLVFDEFSATPVEVATDLIERIRSFNVQVVLGVQSFVGLGPHADRLLSASNWMLMHRTANPEPFIKSVGEYAGKSLIDPLSVRRLADGAIFVANKAHVAQVAVERWKP